MRALARALAVVVLLAPQRAWADPSPPSERARIFFRVGNEAFEGGQYRVALRSYEEAYAIEPLPETAFSMGQAARLAFFADRDPALLARAIAHFEVYLAAVPSGRRRAHAVQHIAALEALRALAPPRDPVAPEPAPDAAKETLLLIVSRTPGARARVGEGPWSEVPLASQVSPGTHVVHVTAPGHAPSEVEWPVVEGRMVVAQTDLDPLPGRLRIDAPDGAQIALDGRLVGSSPLAGPLAVDPGSHELAVSVSGREVTRRKLVVGPGEARAVGVGLAPRTDARVVSFVLLATGGALATAGAATAVVAWSAEERAKAIESDLGRRPLAGEDLEDHGSAVGTRDAGRTVSLALLGGAVATGLSGLVLFAVDASASSTPGLAASVGPTGVRAGGTF